MKERKKMNDQWKSLKQAVIPQALVFLAQGDHFSTYGSDASALREALKKQGINVATPCSFPKQALHLFYIPKLIESGFYVALARPLSKTNPTQAIYKLIE